METFDRKQVVGILNQILEAELAGVVRYTHHALMVYGYSRIPIVKWLRSQAEESLLHANEAGEMITHIGGAPSLAIGTLLEKHTYSIGKILQTSLEHEKRALGLYNTLEQSVHGKSVILEEYARKMIAEEEKHVGDVEKMLRKPDED